MFVSGGDSCLSIFGALWDRRSLVFPQGATILEVGCAEADWITPMLQSRPDLTVTGIDWRQCERPGMVIQGDVLTWDFPAASFDAVVGISSFEHIGLGHYQDDPLDAEGDRHCLERVVRWLKPGGIVYGDVPYGDTYHVVGTSHRVYDDEAVQSRLLVPGLTLVQRWFFASDGLAPQDTPPTVPGGEMVYVALLATKA